MQVFNIHAAKTQLSRLLEEVARGEEIIIARAGKPVAKLVSVRNECSGARVLGRLKGRLRVPADFDAPLPDEVLDAFEGR
ncbi:MAG: type II toxin-antitoxin system prevent-host-death family antitoxin [Acetobacteraceae bacterium]|nr:type II toxin-antitoxin system prevent-host-death family antitoxin [Acetobacteraceae bacterium]